MGHSLRVVQKRALKEICCRTISCELTADVNQSGLGRIRHTDQINGVLILMSTLTSMHVESSDVGQLRSYFILFCVGCLCCDTEPAPAA
jgi:hypothetical protein